MNAWEIVLIVIAALLAVILLVLIIPIGLSVSYDGGSTEVSVRFLFLKFKIAGGKKKDKKTGKAEKRKRKKKEEKKAPGKPDLELIKQLLPEIPPLLKKLLKTIRIRHVFVEWPVYKPDPVDNGTAVGAAYAVIGSLMPLINANFNIRYDKINIIPDFGNERGGRVKASFTVYGSAGAILISAKSLIRRYLALRAGRKKESGGKA
ncbi:MAG: DUF2953 domain-containing protein [Oscillospiraceae bacterium]|jgi:hypothetical protein